MSLQEEKQARAIDDLLMLAKFDGRVYRFVHDGMTQYVCEKCELHDRCKSLDNRARVNWHGNPPCIYLDGHWEEYHARD